MANMSYCRFENTYRDMQDCVDALEEEGFESLSENEKHYAKLLVKLANELTLAMNSEEEI